MMKFMKIFKETTHIDFMGMSKKALILASVLIILSIGSVFMKGLSYGIDFKGGLLVNIKSEMPLNISEMRQKLNLEDLTIQSVGSQKKEFQIYTSDVSGKKNETLDKIKKALGAGIDYQKVEMVGPKIGNELINKSILATILAALCITLYIAFRFEWPFAITAMVALAHDLTLSLGFISFFGLDFNMTIVAALMSLVGYSVNDTVVSFDRIRDNLRKYRKLPVKDVLNKSINEMLSRTVLTSATTFLMVLILVLFGGETLFGFSSVFLFGVVIGTFSSIFIAVPLLMRFDIRKVGEKEVVNEEFKGAEKYEREAQKLPLEKCSSCKKCS
ncbi:MAG: protein translocase subunit SecF [Alphaproteobacteria bacterium]|nr:protein translocase subunit SecF [Alphaproteobacteria bacterium]NCB49183.1 protein translocase subunit SecF [Alphaproteobacteria bacterium]